MNNAMRHIKEPSNALHRHSEDLHIESNVEIYESNNTSQYLIRYC